MDQAQPEEGIFRLHPTDDARIFPSHLAGGPWDAEHQHGGAVSGLLTRSLHQIKSPVPMRLTRMTIEMFRGVPLRELRIETRIVRAGRRIQSVEAGLFDGETQVARATGLRIRRDDDLAELETETTREAALGLPPESVSKPDYASASMRVPGFIGAVDIETEMASTCGTPMNVWTRLRCRLMEGEETPPIVRLATLVDFTSGTGNAMDYTKYTSINPDLSIHVLREPRSDWIGIRGVTLRDAEGIGQSLAEIHDLDGPIGSVQASLLLDKR